MRASSPKAEGAGVGGRVCVVCVGALQRRLGALGPLELRAPPTKGGSQPGAGPTASHRSVLALGYL